MTPREILNIIEIVFYAPVLVVSVLVCAKHGFARSGGYFFMLILALLRLIGASTGIASVNDPTNSSLIVCSLVCSAIGLSPLMLAVLGFQNRLTENCTPSSPVPPVILKLTGLPMLVALILSIVGANEVNSISDLVDGSSYHTYTRIAAGMYILSYILLAAVVVVLTINSHRVASTDKKLLYGCALSMPFIFVRMVYTCLVAFDFKAQADFSLFTDTDKAVAIQGILSFGMEVITVVILLTVAILTPKNITREGQTELEAKQDPQSQNYWSSKMQNQAAPAYQA